MLDAWQKILDILETSLSQDDFNAWILPLQVRSNIKNKKITLIAANKYLKKNIEDSLAYNIQKSIDQLGDSEIDGFVVDIKSSVPEFAKKSQQKGKKVPIENNLNDIFTFESFVEGKSNQLALAASKHVSSSPGTSYNPLYIYGATGLGKTHLMHAIGHELKNTNKNRVLYIRSELFVRDMISAFQQKNINKFKYFYQSLDVLLMDDIQFLEGKDRSQEEFFHSFNYLLEGNSQVVVTCDRYPKEVEQLEDRLKSRFGSGLTVALEPPDLETRVGILLTKSNQAGFDINNEIAFFIARLVKSNVRELEGALNNVYALARLTNSKITTELVKTALKKLISVQNRIISIDNIQQLVASYFHIGVSDLLSKSRSRSVVRPRQIAMMLTKELTDKSLPEIGKHFGGRDHTTVIHACRKINDLINTNDKVSDDYKNLRRQLSA